MAAILALALYLGAAGSATPVQAAPGADETVDSFSMSVSGIESPACAHALYEVEVFTRADRVANRNGSNLNLEGGLGPADIYVKGSSSDTGVASFHPETLKTTALDNRIGRGADFVLQTEAPGSATLTLTAALTSAGESLTFPPVQEPIQVVNCKFRITMTSILSGFAPAIAETVVSTVTGEIGGKSDGSLTGEAEVTWKFNQATPCLRAIINVSPSPASATLEGSLSEDGSLLTVHVNYDQVMVFQQNTITCEPGGSGSQQHQFQPPPVTFSAPTTGSVFSQPISLPVGEMTVSGTAIISVMPVERK
jgi:hypothetical protein